MRSRRVVGRRVAAVVAPGALLVAYPGGDGEIVHTYRGADDVTITVTTIWEATFTAPGTEQALPAREYETTHELQVDELRAVRVHPDA